MLGSGKSSASIWTAFDTQSTAGTRYPSHALSVAWTRIKDDATDFFTIDTSIIGGPDIIQGQLNVITEPDTFKYYDETERVVSLMYDRRVEEPLGGLTYALGDITFDNTTKRFSWGVSDTIGTSLRPRRPLKMFMGFRVPSYDAPPTHLPVLYGVTDDVEEIRENGTARVPASDYVSYVSDYELESTMFTDQRSDEIIASLLLTTGFSTQQYDLDEGLNTIGFAWFPKGTKAGDAIRQICEAEEGHFFQDEEGLLRFENRRNYLNKSEVTWTINKEDTLEYQRDRSVPILNRVTVKAQPRAVQSVTEVWKSGITIPLQTSQALEVWATFENPVTTITNPVATTDYTVNTLEDGTGTDITSDVSVGIDKFVESAKLTFTNTGPSGFITFARVRGTPATITSDIQEIYEDEASMEDYGRKQLTIQNNFIDSEDFAYYLCRALVRKYSTPLKRLRVTIPGQPAIQVTDKVTVQDPDLNTCTDYRVMRVIGRMTPTTFTSTLILREVTGVESDSPFIIGTSTIGSETEVIWV